LAAKIVRSIDVTSLGALPSIELTGAPVLVDTWASVIAALALRHSVKAAPSIPLHGAYDVDEFAAGAVAVAAGVLSVVWALTILAAAKAAARSNTRGLNEN